MLILLCLISVLGSFFLTNLKKRIIFVICSYNCFIVLIIFIAKKNNLGNELTNIMISMLFIMAINIVIGIGIITNIFMIKKNKSIKNYK